MLDQTAHPCKSNFFFWMLIFHHTMTWTITGLYLCSQCVTAYSNFAVAITESASLLLIRNQSEPVKIVTYRDCQQSNQQTRRRHVGDRQAVWKMWKQGVVIPFRGQGVGIPCSSASLLDDAEGWCWEWPRLHRTRRGADRHQRLGKARESARWRPWRRDVASGESVGGLGDRKRGITGRWDEVSLSEGDGLGGRPNVQVWYNQMCSMHAICSGSWAPAVKACPARAPFMLDKLLVGAGSTIMTRLSVNKTIFSLIVTTHRDARMLRMNMLGS